MMLTILGLPPTTKYKDLKLLIKTRCNLNDFILDDLVGDNNGLKKVRIGLADGNEGSHLIKCLDGYRMAGCTLSIVPVGKSQIPQQNFEQRGNFNQPHNNYQQNEYNDRPLPWGQSNAPQNQQQQLLTSSQWTSNPIGGQGPPNNFGFQQGGAMQNNQYMPPQQHQNSLNQYPNQHNQSGHIGGPHNQNTGSHGHSQGLHGPPPIHDVKQYPPRDQFNRSQQDQGYGLPRNNVPEPVTTAGRTHVLRTVEIVDTPPSRPSEPNRYPGQGYPSNNKPIPTIKDSFQGPNQYAGPGAGPPATTTQPWMQQPQKPSFEKPSGSYDKPAGQYDKPAGPYDKPFDRASKPEPERHYKPYDKDYDRSSPRREMRKSPMRKVSPRRSPVRGMRHSPGRISPRRHSPGRRVSPNRRSPVRRMSPGRRLSSERRPSPGRREPPRDLDRRPSPGRIGPTMEGPPRPAWSARRVSPAKRSPDRRPDTGSTRFSPSRRLDKRDDFLDHGKTVRPAYDPPSQAPNQAMYSGGYRPNVNDKGPYPVPGPRPVEPRESPWQQDRDKSMRTDMLKRDEERSVQRAPFDRPGPRMEKDKRSHSPRKSRSPIRRDNSPSRDRFKRHSPSPRSPRRSWALEKRRSPEDREAPPPPIWPGQVTRGEKKTEFNIEDTKRRPVWEGVRRPDDDGRFPPQEPIRVRTDLGPRPERREDLEFKREERFGRDGPKFSPRDDFDKKGPKFSPRDDFDKKGPKFSPRDDFDKKPKFNPRDDFDDKRPKFVPFSDNRPHFEPREEFTKPPKFSSRDAYEEPGFSREDMMRKDPKYARDFERPKFSPRDDFDDRRDDFRRHDVEQRKHWDGSSKSVEREDFRRDIPLKRPDVARMDLHRDVFRKMSEELDKEFEDVHKRAQDFHKRAEEFRRDDRRRDYDDRPKSYEDDRNDFRYEERKGDWNTAEHIKNKAIKAKKDKAVDEISQKILDKHNIDADAEQNQRMVQELKLSMSRIIEDMFGNSDVSFIEMIVKFNAKYSGTGEDKILRDVMSSFPSSFKPKRSAPDYSQGSSSSSRRSPEPTLSKGVEHTNPVHVPEWDMTPAMPNPGSFDMYAHMMPPMMVAPPMMVPAPMYPTFQEPVQLPANNNQNLYLCKDDFQPFLEHEADALRVFLIEQIVKESEASQGWAPDFTFKGLQSFHRYELHTRDDASRNWLLNYDFSSFKFNILVYTSEELWYERAAIWLPGHSMCRSIAPLDKLKLQNKKLEGANVGKWKLVKKIVTTKGIRVYVDMPPSAARALEKHKMSLSYELQKVNVFLKAVAIDKDAFDLGLKDRSKTNEAEIIAAALNTPMPSLPDQPKVVKLCLPGIKPLSIMQARKVREMLTYHIFKYHNKGGESSTDFIQHGFVNPGFFGVVPENEESKNWLMNLQTWKLKRQQLVVVGADESNTRYIGMVIYLPHEECRSNAAIALERLKQSNRGVKGINFNKWKAQNFNKDFSKKSVKVKLEVDIDVESVETIIKMDYKLDYVDDRNSTQVVEVKYYKSEKHLFDLIKKYKTELHDTYDDIDMDLASSGSDDDDDVICLDK